MHDSKLPFAYESRVQKFSSSAHEYVWCVENLSEDTPAFFRWGNKQDDERYLSVFVPPKRAKFARVTDSRGTDIDSRVIKFRGTDSPDWKSIGPQTIIIRNTRYDQVISRELWSRPARPKIELVQAKSGTLEKELESYKTADGLVNVALVSKNRDLLRAYILREKEMIGFHYTSTFSLPANVRVLAAIRDGNYKKYNPADFIDMRISINDRISLKGGNPFSDISMMVVALDETRAKELAELPISLQMRPVGDGSTRAPKELLLDQPIFPLGSRMLLEREIVLSLSTVDMIVSVSDNSDNKVTYFKMPVRLLLAGEISK